MLMHLLTIFNQRCRCGRIRPSCQISRPRKTQQSPSYPPDDRFSRGVYPLTKEKTQNKRQGGSALLVLGRSELTCSVGTNRQRNPIKLRRRGITSVVSKLVDVDPALAKLVNQLKHGVARIDRAHSDRARSASKKAGRPSHAPASHSYLSSSYIFYTPRLAGRRSPLLRASNEHSS